MGKWVSNKSADRSPKQRLQPTVTQKYANPAENHTFIIVEAPNENA
jgi:hypothetical protein